MASNALKSAYKLYVGNIPWTVSTRDLMKYFSKFGPINYASVVFDKNTGLSRNYGFVVFGKKEAFDKSRNSFHVLEGNTLRLEVSKKE